MKALVSKATGRWAKPGTRAGATDRPAPRSEAERRPETLGAIVLQSAEYGSKVALRFPLDGQTASLSYAQLALAASEIARGLIALGVQPGEHVAILSSTRAQWTLVDCGALCAGVVVVPVYHTNSPEECAYVLGHSEAHVIVCEDDSQAEKIRRVRERLPQLEQIVLIEGAGGEDAITLSELRERGVEEVPERAVRERVRNLAADDVATLVYTSGTTGPPKGCVLTHANLVATARMYSSRLQIDSTHVLYQFLPLAHVLARVAQFVILDTGAEMCFWSGDPAKILDEVAAMQPTHFPAVPRIYEKIHGAVLGRVEDGSALQRTLFKRALSQGRTLRRMRERGLSPGPVRLARRRVADALVLSKIRRIFGRRLQVALVGAAPVAKDLLEFFDACGVTVLEGYGLTETTAAATLNAPGDMRLGTVGLPLEDTEVRIAPDGEILLHGPNVFKGYYKNTAATNEVLKDGWLATGDLGTITNEGYLTVTGRKKDLIITSSGKNITPVNIENALRETRWISEAVVYGDGRSYLVALLTLDVDELGKLARRLGLPSNGNTTAAAAASDEGVRAAVREAVDEVNAKLARIEQVKRFTILDHDLTQAAGEMTPTLKVKRAAVYERYADELNALYRTESPS
jgi:long-chain acyl-CoA synthetase